ncbi:CPBP family intramembrane glutamic endopeptidase [Brevibacillus ginsengisoli]|uniref:CPBP family intramembrane glutamic endopeptidase n=1 Tax=Brevibacillus ginsengisoli TaxID=363854 RepID=UPI003CEA2442
MGLLLLLLGPTIMIFMGLQVFSSVPLTFVLFYGWLFLVPVVNMRFVQKNTWGETAKALGLSGNRRNSYLGIASGLIFGLSIILSGYFFHTSLFDLANLGDLLSRWGFSGNLVTGLILVLIGINPLLEEIYWRGYLYQKLEGRWGSRVTILLTSLFYSLYHLLSVIPLFNWPYNLLAMLPVFLAGVFWGYMRMVSRTLVGSIFSHILGDCGIIGVYLLFIK